MLSWKSLVLLFVTVEITKCYITRLANRYHAEFQRKENVYYSFAHSNHPEYKIIPYISEDDCVLSCVTDSKCVLVNYKRDGTECRLLDSSQGLLIPNTLWVFLYTRSPGAEMGKFCEEFKPCSLLELCKDVEAEPGYVCLPLINVALVGVATQSSVSYGGYPGRAIDGGLSSSYSSSTITHTLIRVNPWWRVELTKPYEVIMVRIYNRMDCCPERLTEFILTVGALKSSIKENAFCSFVDQYNIRIKDYYCEYGFLTGQYVSVVTQKTTAKVISLAEVQIWALP